jgi:hypothetical protein
VLALFCLKTKIHLFDVGRTSWIRWFLNEERQQRECCGFTNAGFVSRHNKHKKASHLNKIRAFVNGVALKKKISKAQFEQNFFNANCG